MITHISGGAALEAGAADAYPEVADLDALAPDPYKGIGALLPKLARPPWVRLIGKAKPKREPARAPSAPARKAMRRNARKFTRLQRALAGEHTRVSRTAA